MTYLHLASGPPPSLPPSPIRRRPAKQEQDTMRNFATTLLASIASLAVSATMFNAILV
ncbi:hypothetical protein [Alteraurantiacibacter lauratis]|uniref:hypothetical protein n=1 Tax=Alteraurantiacibacter lauratis TaxID=2054627 RepID=UPI003671E20E